MLVIIIDGLALLILSWNGHFTNAASPSLLIVLWTLLVAAAIYLLVFAAKQTLADYLLNRQQLLFDSYRIHIMKLNLLYLVDGATGERVFFHHD